MTFQTPPPYTGPDQAQQFTPHPGHPAQQQPHQPQPYPGGGGPIPPIEGNWARYTSQLTLAMPTDHAAGLIGEALRRNGVVSGRPQPGIVMGTTPTAMFSWGTTITATLSPGQAGTHVHLRIAPSMSLTWHDFGQSKRLFTKVLTTIVELAGPAAF